MGSPQEIVEIVLAVEAKRIVGMPAAITFWSRNDVWQFHGYFDERICDICVDYALKLYHGNVVRGVFPYWEIVDVDFINVHVHPNCRCWLSRVPEE